MCELKPVEPGELTAREKSRLKAFEKEIRHWHGLLLLDALWKVGLVVLDDEGMGTRLAYADIGRSEYWEADIGLSRRALEVPVSGGSEARKEIVSHEMIHLLTADYHRAALAAAGGDERLNEELTYRYEQLVTKLSRILCLMDTALETAMSRKRKAK